MKRISWKKGMRLTDEILRASDDAQFDFIGKSFLLAAAGRFGLLPSQRSFDVSIDIGKDYVSVTSLTCLAVTKDGHIIDVQYDTRYNNSFDTRVQIPSSSEMDEFILTVNSHSEQWKEVADGWEEQAYSFSLISPDSIVPDNAMPIVRIVDDYGWRVDDLDFVPPCLFVSSHRKYEELLNRFSDVLASLDGKAKAAANSSAHNLMVVFWPIVQQLRIAADKEWELWTPMTLLSKVQKCVSAFTCACDLDESIELSDAKMYKSYITAPYNYKEAYQRIKVGIDICHAIADKIEKLASALPSQPPKEMAKLAAPKLADESKDIICNTSETTLSVIYNNSQAMVYFTIDGSDPSQKSLKASRARDGFKIKFDNGFRKEKGKESQKKIAIKLIAVEGDVYSDVSTAIVTLQKDLKFRNAIPI